MDLDRSFDIIIIGGSYAGLSAAMALGRSLKQVLIIDAGVPCNAQTPHAHNLITHDGSKPAAIAAAARQQVFTYPTIQLINDLVTQATGTNGSFSVTTQSGASFTAKKLLLATGVKDVALPIKGFAECWGISILHCPYCHGYEVRNETLGVIANGDIAFHYTMLISNWSPSVTLFTNGASMLTKEQKHKLNVHNINVVEQQVAAIEHTAGKMHNLVFANGKKHTLDAVFAKADVKHHTDIADQLGCEMQAEGHNKGLIKIDEFGKTSVAGVYAAGDITNAFRSLAQSISAGNKAGPIINMELITEAF